MSHIHITDGDITQLAVDAIVNAANAALSGGGGVDGAIHRAAGPGLIEECRTIGRCPTGEAVITRGYNLPAKYVIHAVGPVWWGGDHGERALLASCYRRSLELALEYKIQTIAFPAISCGAYKFPIEDAARIAIDTIRGFLNDHPETFSEVLLVCFDPKVKTAYLEYFKKVAD